MWMYVCVCMCVRMRLCVRPSVRRVGDRRQSHPDTKHGLIYHVSHVGDKQHQHVNCGATPKDKNLMSCITKAHVRYKRNSCQV
jgi:hypothetical protein